MADSQDHDILITELCGLTGASPQEAQQYLTANRWDLQGAAAEFFTSQEEVMAEAQGDADHETEPESTSNYSGPRTLDGRPAPAAIPTIASSSRAPRGPPRSGIATLGSLGAQDEGHGHAHDDDDSDDEDYQPRDLFAGGEKSALAVQDPRRPSDPRKIMKDLEKMAKANAQSGRPPRGEPAPPSRFRGTGMTLGGEDAPSQAVLDPTASAPPSREVVTRTLNIWADGFSVEDGPLRRFDDPSNAADLAMIRMGRAPLHLINVEPHQEVDVQLVKHEGPFVAPKKKYTAFEGGGQRLGSPTPGVSSSSSAPTPAAAPEATQSTTPAPVEQQVDSSQPTLSLRVQLADGQRLPARFNASHTIGDVYGFVERASPNSNSRPWVLATTFPNQEHTDKSAVLGEMPEFKKGGVVVQKWT